VEGPTAATRRPFDASANERASDALRSSSARKTFWLVRNSQSNCERSRSALSNGVKSSGGAKLIRGNRMGVARRASSSRQSDSPCPAARVTTMRLPASGDAVALATLAPHFFEDALRSGFHQKTGHMFAELRCVFRRRRGTLFHILQAVDRTDARLED